MVISSKNMLRSQDSNACIVIPHCALVARGSSDIMKQSETAGRPLDKRLFLPGLLNTLGAGVQRTLALGLLQQLLLGLGL